MRRKAQRKMRQKRRKNKPRSPIGRKRKDKGHREEMGIKDKGDTHIAEELRRDRQRKADTIGERRD